MADPIQGMYEHSQKGVFVRVTLAVLCIAVASGMAGWEEWAQMFILFGPLAFIVVQAGVGKGGVGRAALRAIGFTIWAVVTSGVSIVVYRSRLYDKGEDALAAVVGVAVGFGIVAGILGSVASLTVHAVRVRRRRIPKQYTIGLIEDVRFRSQMHSASWVALAAALTLLPILPLLGPGRFRPSGTLLEANDIATLTESIAKFQVAVQVISTVITLGCAIWITVIAIAARRRLLSLEHARCDAAAAVMADTQEASPTEFSKGPDGGIPEDEISLITPHWEKQPTPNLLRIYRRKYSLLHGPAVFEAVRRILLQRGVQDSQINLLEPHQNPAPLRIFMWASIGLGVVAIVVIGFAAIEPRTTDPDEYGTYVVSLNSQGLKFRRGMSMSAPSFTVSERMLRARKLSTLNGTIQVKLLNAREFGEIVYCDHCIVLPEGEAFRVAPR